MNIIQEYISRYPEFQNYNYNQKPFFTEFENDTYIHKLPYIQEIDRFCFRLKQAIDEGETICIYSDYDTDAVTATATMYYGLIILGVKETQIEFYAPNRFTEGYGMNTQAIEKLSKTYSLIISVDCGINSTKEAEIVANQQGCDLIITDHHHLAGAIPHAVAVINPRLNELSAESDIWQNRILTRDSLETPSDTPQISPTSDNRPLLSSSTTGVGVAWFSLVWLGYYLHATHDQFQHLNSLLSFVAIGTIADCQSIIEPTNRLMVMYGLKYISKQAHPSVGLQEIMRQTGLSEKIADGYTLTSQDLGFTLSPILNSSGRLSHASLSIKSLIDPQPHEYVTQLIQTNEDRKSYIKEIITDISAEAAEQFNSGAKILWLHGDWSQGVIGLIASRLVNEYNLPTIIITDNPDHPDTAHASLRAPKGIHLPNTMQQFHTLFTGFGGHPGAAGFTAPKAHLKQIRQGFETSLVYDEEVTQTQSYVPEYILNKYIPNTTEYSSREAELEHVITLPSIAPFNSITHIWLTESEFQDLDPQEIFKLDPFGQDFGMPHIVIDINNYDDIFWMKEKLHAKITLGNHKLTIFNLDDTKRSIIQEMKPARISCKVSQNVFRGNLTYEFIIEKIVSLDK